MSNKLPTVKQICATYRKLVIDMGFSDKEALEDIVSDLLTMAREYRDAAKAWEKDCEKLKAKYEPMILA
jgi:hypothetical protein